ncbi:hypothetical protein KDK77_06870 [bacterium]|nr:hypothetical protein [bacterium]MCP5461737.1 hypothetical protein [bacterium]
MKKFFGFLLFLTIIMVLGLYLTRNTLLKTAVEKGVTIGTGLPLKIGSIDLNFTSTYFGMNNFELHNPENFPDEIMLNIPEVFVDYNLTSIIRGIIHLEEVRLDMEQLTVVKNKDGKLNIFQIKTPAASPSKDGQEPAGKPTEESAEIPLKIDTLKVRIGKFSFKDYSKGPAPTVVELPIKFDETFTDVEGVNSVLKLILTRVLSKTNLAAIANIDLKEYQAEVNKMLKESTDKMMEQTKEQIQENAEKVLEEKLNISEEDQKALKNKLSDYLKKSN